MTEQLMFTHEQMMEYATETQAPLLHRIEVLRADREALIKRGVERTEEIDRLKAELNALLEAQRRAITGEPSLMIRRDRNDDWRSVRVEGQGRCGEQLMPTIVATLTIVQKGTTISLMSSVAEEHENSVPAKLVEIAQDAVSTYIAETCDVPKARTETVWDSKQ